MTALCTLCVLCGAYLRLWHVKRQLKAVDTFAKHRGGFEENKVH